MNPSPNLRLANSGEPTRQQIAMAQIQQNMYEWRSPWADVVGASDDKGRKVGWRAYNGPTGPCANDVGEITRRQYRVVVDAAVPWWRRAWRWVSGKVGRR